MEVSLQDKDRIFTNLYGFQPWNLEAARTRGDWADTKDLMSVGPDGLIDLGSESSMILFQLIMGIPRLAGFMPDLQKANASFHQAASDQKLATINRIAVRLSDGLRFMTNIERIAGFRLHAIREFKRLNSRVELRIIRTSLTMTRVESLDEI